MSLRPRFSLRTLLLLVLTIAGAIGIWWRWEPWVYWKSLENVQTCSSDQKLAVVKPPDSSPSVIHVESGETVSALQNFIPQPEDEKYPLFYFSDDGSRVFYSRHSPKAAGLPGPPVQTWEVRSGREIRTNYHERWAEISEGDQEMPWKRESISPDGRLIVNTCRSKDIVTLESVESTEAVLRMKRNSSYVFPKFISRQPRFSPNGNWLAAPSGEFWNLKTGESGRVDIPFGSPLDMAMGGELEFSPDSRFIAVHFVLASQEKKAMGTNRFTDQVAVWDLATRRQVALINAGGSLYISPDNTSIAIVTYDFTVLIWDLKNNKKLLECQGAFGGFAPDSQRIIVFEPVSSNPPFADVWSLTSSIRLARFNGVSDTTFVSEDIIRVVGASQMQFFLKRRRPEQWWGVAWLPEFWIAAVCAIGATWSAVIDRKKLRKA